MKKLISILMAAMLLLSTCALAAPGDATLFIRDMSGASAEEFYPYSAAVVGDTVYIFGQMNDMVLLELKVGQSEPQTHEIESNGNDALYALRLFADGDKLMALDTTNGEIGEMALENGKASFRKTGQLDWTGMAEDNGEWTETRECSSPAVKDGTLYLTAMTIDYSGYELLAFDLAGGAQRVMAQNFYSAPVFGREGEILYIKADEDDWKAPATLCSVSMADGSATEICKLASRSVYGLAYDAENSRVIYCAEGAMYAVDFNGQNNEIGSLPVSNAYGLNCTSAVLPGGYYLLSSSEGTVVRNLDPQYKPSRSLTIRCSYLQVDKTYLDFTEKHPDVAVKALTGDGSISSDEVTQDMMNGSSEADIYELNVDSAAFNAMVNRGYTADLSGSQVLSQLVARMYPQLSEALMKDGKLIAFPKEYYDSVMTFNVELAKKMGMGDDPVPKNWNELLDLVERWDSEYAQNFPEKTLFDPGRSASMKETLFGMLLNDYTVLLNRPGQEQKYNTEALRALMERLDRIDYSAFNSEKDFSNGYSWSSDDVLIDNWGNFMPSVNGGRDGSQSMLLSIGDGMEPCVPVTMSVYVINPYSKNMDLALEYLETCAANMNDGMSAAFLSDWTQAVPNPWYEQSLASYQKQEAQVQEMLENGKEEEKQLAESMKADLESWRENLEKSRYLYSEEDLAKYREQVKYLVIMRNNYLYSGGESAEEMQALISRYVDGQMDAGQMLSALDQKLRMMQMEDQ